MERKFVSCCRYPTTVVLVDDNEGFLESISFKLGRKIPHKKYTDPLKAMKFLKEEYQANPFTKRCLLRPEEQHRDHRNIEVDVRAIHQEVYNPKRFNEISVLVVDYAMPGMNGLEFCQQLKNNPFKVILLTGEADEKVAIELFNKGIINRFIRKDVHDFTKILVDSIYELQEEYFKEQSEIVINSLTKNPDYPPCCLDDPVFANFFEQFCLQHQFAEYYLFDETGSFVFLDANSKPSLLIVRDESEMKAALFNAETSDEEVPPFVIEALKNKEKILYRSIVEEFHQQSVNWLSSLHTAKKLEGRATYYYAYIDDPSFCSVDVNKILSYKSYLNQL